MRRNRIPHEKNRRNKICARTVIVLMLLASVCGIIIRLTEDIPTMEDIYFQAYGNQTMETVIYKYDADTEKVYEVGKDDGYFHNCKIDSGKKHITGVRSPWYPEEVYDAESGLESGIVRYSLEDGTAVLLRSEQQMRIGNKENIVWDCSFPFDGGEKRIKTEDGQTESITIDGKRIEIKKEVLNINGDIDKRYIEYPYLDSDNDIAKRINQHIYALIDKECLWNSEYTIDEEITYEIMSSDDQFFSIHFTGYRSVAASYADFDMALNIDTNSGEIVTLQSFYTLSEISEMVSVAMTENKMSVVNIPLKEEEMQDYMNRYFKKVFSNDSYIRRSDNFFVKNGNLYFIAESYPSLRQYIYIEWKDVWLGDKP